LTAVRTLLVHRDPEARERIAGLLRAEGLEVGINRVFDLSPYLRRN